MNIKEIRLSIPLVHNLCSFCIQKLAVIAVRSSRIHFTDTIRLAVRQSIKWGSAARATFCSYWSSWKSWMVIFLTIARIFRWIVVVCFLDIAKFVKSMFLPAVVQFCNISRSCPSAFGSCRFRGTVNLTLKYFPLAWLCPHLLLPKFLWLRQWWDVFTFQIAFFVDAPPLPWYLGFI